MGSGTIPPAMTNGAGRRKSESWIDQFVAYHDNLESPIIWRRWAAITAISSVLEQKVWLQTSSHLYPNLYTTLVGHPGTGKTRAVRAVRRYLHEIKDFHMAPTSLTAASLVDALTASKRSIVKHPDPMLEYNSMAIVADELGSFMHKYDNEMVAVLSSFYDPDPYGQDRRGKEIKIRIKSPQLNILAGSTPSNLLQFVPEGAWEQGFMSRMILVYSDEKIIGDDFATESKPLSKDLLHDLNIINTLHGKYSVSGEYRDAVNAWRASDEQVDGFPKPSHPKLAHYNTRRRVHLYKLSMVAAAERSNALLITKDDFNRAMSWLVEAESQMPEIFTASGGGLDAQVLDEAAFFCQSYTLTKKLVPEQALVRFISQRVPAHTVMRVVDNMVRSGMLDIVSTDERTSLRVFRPRG